MTRSDFDDTLRRAAEGAIAYRTVLPGRPHRPDASYQDMQAAFAEPLPEQGSQATKVIDDLVARASPGLIGMAGPRFFGWVIGGSHPVGVAADWLTSAWGQNTGNHKATPAAAAAEEAAAAWLLELLDLPRQCSIGFVTGATAANMVGLAAARGEVLRRAGWDAEADGLFGAPPITVFIGDDAHVTVFQALKVLGLGTARVTRIAADDQGRMRSGALALAMASAGTGPKIVIGQAGQLNTGAFDPFDEIVPIARQHGAWLHVDGAFGLWARAAPSVAAQARGLDGADSWATDGHKWLQTPYDCGYAIVRHPDAHRRAMTAAASYLPDEAPGERDPSRYVPELSRRARGFATWAIIRHLGRTGIVEMIERHCRLARQMAELLSRGNGIKVVNDVTLNQMIVRFGAGLDDAAGDAATLAVIDRLQQDGTCYVGGAKWRDRWVMRISVIGYSTTEADIEMAAAAMLREARAVG